MAIEVEIKLPVSDLVKVQQDLERLGLKKGDTLLESDIYFTSEHHDFRKLDQALRIRRTENRTSGYKKAAITYKGAKLDRVSMAREELETLVEDGELLQKILERIGFRPVTPVEKSRTYYRKDNLTACADRVKNLGDFLELEIIVPSAEEREAALEQIEELLEKLGCSMADTTRVSYLSALMAKESKEAKEDY